MGEDRLLIKAAMRSAEAGHLAEQIKCLERSGIDALHFDVMDGHFVPEICAGLSLIRGLRPYTDLPFEVHLLVEHPERWVESYVAAGSNCILLHLEAVQDPREALWQVRQQGCHAGLAIRPGTPARAVRPYLALCDAINVMTVTPGVPGQLNPEGLSALAETTALVHEAGGGQLVQADGAVSLATRAQFLQAGARSLVAGYPIFSAPDMRTAIAHLRWGGASGERVDAGCGAAEGRLEHEAPHQSTRGDE